MPQPPSGFVLPKPPSTQADQELCELRLLRENAIRRQHPFLDYLTKELAAHVPQQRASLPAAASHVY